MRLKIPVLQTYIIAVTIFYSVLVFIPGFNNSYFLPKLTIIKISSFIIFVLETIKIFSYRNKKISYINSLQIFIIIFLLLNFISAFFSDAKIISIFGLYEHEGLDFASIFSISSIVWIYSKLDQKNQTIIKNFILGAISISALYTIYIYYYSKFVNGIIDRPLSTEGHPIWSAGLTTVGLFLLVRMTINKGFFLVKKFILFLSLPFVMALFFYDSSTCWITFISSLLITLSGYIFSQKKITLKFKVAFILILLSFLILTVRQFVSKEEFSINKRVNEIKSTWQAIKKEVFLSEKNYQYFFIGHGQSMSGFYLNKYRSPKLNLDQEWYSRPAIIHNHFLEVFFSTGFLSLLIWLLIFSYLWLKYFKRKDWLNFLMITFLIIWQFFYFLPINMYILCLFVIAEDKFDIKFLKPAINKLNNYQTALFFTTVITIFSSLTLFIGMKSVLAEFYYSTKDIQKAYQINQLNDKYMRDLVIKNINQYDQCKNIGRLKSNSFCSEKNLQKIIKNADQLIQKTISINSYNPESWNLLSSVKLRLSFLQKNGHNNLLNEAEKAQIKTITLDPTDPLYNDGLGLIYLEMKNYSKAEYYFKKAIELKPDLLPIYKHLLEIYRVKNEHEKQLKIEKQISNIQNANQSGKY